MTTRNLLSRFQSSKMALGALMTVLVIGLVVLVLAEYSTLFNRKQIRIGLTRSHSSFLVLIADERDFFSDEGLEVALVPYADSILALEAMWKGEVDFTVPYQSQLAASITKGFHPEVVTEMFSSSSLTAIVYRPDRGIRSVSDLKGKTVGLLRGSNAEFVLDLLLATATLSTSDVQIVNVAWEDHAREIRKGQLDALVTWEPLVAQLLKEQKGELESFGADFYTEVASLVTTSPFSKRFPTETGKLVKALYRAHKYYQENSFESQTMLSERLNAYEVDDAAWEKMNPHIGLSSVLLTMLQEESDWLRRRDGVDLSRGREIRGYLVPDYLRQVAPDLVTYE